MQGIYKIKNKLNGKYYVGSSIDIDRRFIEHQMNLERGIDSPYLQNAWNKYGKENFVFEFVEKVENEESLRSVEQKYLDYGFEKGLLYNIAKITKGRGRGWHHNE